MNLGIVIPLKAKAVSRDWSLTCANLQATLNSVKNQKCEKFSCVVVGHDCPDFLSDGFEGGGAIKFLRFNEFLPPEVGGDESKNQLKYEFDRCSKILKGIMHLNSSYKLVTHYFALDADDLVRCDFIDKLQKYSNFDAVILDKGYFLFKKFGILNEEDEFSAYCGSSAVVSKSIFNVPIEIDANSFRETPFGRISHVNMRRRLMSEGLNVGVMKERVVMYVRDNGENISNAAYCNTLIKKLRKFIKMIISFRFFNKNLKKSFGVI